MPSYRLTVGSVFVFLTISLGQSGGRDNPWIGLRQIDNGLSAAHVSGSLAYSSCGFHRSVPDAPPPIRVLSEYSGPPKKVLEEMFADDLRMQVTREEGGLIRMVEKDVPTDILDLKIHHLSFSTSHGPGMAVLVILMNPEVRAFQKAHNIGPPDSDGFNVPGDAMSNKPVVYGKLDDVTVSQALDYILQTFPGFWVYENCVSEGGERSVYFNFVGFRPPRSDNPKPK